MSNKIELSGYEVELPEGVSAPRDPERFGFHLTYKDRSIYVSDSSTVQWFKAALKDLMNPKHDSTKEKSQCNDDCYPKGGGNVHEASCVCRGCEVCNPPAPSTKGWEREFLDWAQGILKTTKVYNGENFCALCGTDPHLLIARIRTLIQEARAEGARGVLDEIRRNLEIGLPEHREYGTARQIEDILSWLAALKEPCTQ